MLLDNIVKLGCKVILCC